jgi:hypothetical protein
MKDGSRKCHGTPIVLPQWAAAGWLNPLIIDVADVTGRE